MDAFTIYAFVCLLFAAFNQGQASNQCEVTDLNFCETKSDGNYLNPDYSHGFYTCSNGKVFCMECAKASPPLYYHPDKDYCDYEPPCPPLDAFCAIKMAGMTAAERLQPTRFANPMFKYGYVVCQLNNHECKKCNPEGPDNVEFDPSLKECLTGCDKNFCKDRIDGNYHNPANKHGYIACSNNYTYCMPCAAGHNGEKLFFHRQDNTCEYDYDEDFPNREENDESVGASGAGPS